MSGESRRDGGNAANALFRRYPELGERIAWISLGVRPTPVERLALEDGAAAAGDAWIKRDDLSAEPYGGNKVRKLEFLLAEARVRGARRLITAGAVGSHHALATTVYGRAHGFPVSLVLFPQPLTPHVRDVLLLDHAFGAELHHVPRMELIPAALVGMRLARRRDRPFVIAPGGSDPVGTLGYVAAALELADQIAAGEAPRPDVVYVTAGTLGTAAGLAVGFALAGLDCRIVATRIASRLVTNGRALRRLVEGVVRVLRRAGAPAVEPAAALGRITLDHGQVGRGYGHETAAGRRARTRFAAAGLEVDPTYTAKAAAGFLAALARRNAGTVLFWHTLSATEPVPDAPARVADPAAGSAYGEPRRAPAAAAGVPDLPAPFRRYLEAGGPEPATPASQRIGP
ncbi:MAG TPA: pyridoxal-phosphate dependent enzyme [Longimicrobiales bacterium]